MRTVRPRRRGYFDARRITLGDYIVLVAGLIALVSLFLPWFVSSVPGVSSQTAFAYSEIASVIVIVFFLATLFLVVYPALAASNDLPALPFKPPPVYLFMGVIMALVFDFQLGKYSCITCSGSSRGFGIWLGLVASLAYIMGAIIRWASRPPRRTDSPRG